MVFHSLCWRALSLLLSVVTLLALPPTGLSSLPIVSARAPQKNSSAVGAQRHGPYAVIIVIDAARADEVNLSVMPNLRRLALSGTEYSEAWVGQLPSMTETSHATIGTGVFPYRHLILGETWRVPGTEQMSPDLLNGQLTRTGYIGHAIARTGVPSIARIVHQRYPGSIVVALSGHKIYAADGLGAGAADYVAFGVRDRRGHYVPSAIPGHAPSMSILKSPQLDLPTYPRTPGQEDWWTTTLAEKFLFKYHPRLMMINLPEVDVYGHLAGANLQVMQPLMVNVDRQIGRLLAAYGRAGMLSQTYFVITADHAMVPGQKTVNIDSVTRVIERAGGNPLYVGHGDYCPIWLKNATAVPRVAAALTAAVPGVAAVYARSPNGQYSLVSSPARFSDPQVQSAYADLLGTFDSPEAPDIVLLYQENTITMTPAFLKIGRKGDHGGATWGAQHIPLIIAGPGIKQDYSSIYPARLVDIAPTVETLLGAKPHGQDGVVLADAMVHPAPDLVAAQNQVSVPLLDQVTALQREALGEPGVRNEQG